MSAQIRIITHLFTFFITTFMDERMLTMREITFKKLYTEINTHTHDLEIIKYSKIGNKNVAFLYFFFSFLVKEGSKG